MTDPRTELEDVIDAAEKIERYTDGMSYETFVEDEKTVDAVLRNFEVIGEATKNLPEILPDIRSVMADLDEELGDGDEFDAA